jgi:hypothetical protein
MKSAPQPTLPLRPCLPAASVFNLPHAVRILQPSKPKTVQHLSFQPLAASLPSFCDSHPLFSTAYSLFSQNTRGGGYPRKSPFWNQQLPDSFFRSVCTSVTPVAGVSLRVSVAIEFAGPLFSQPYESLFPQLLYFHIHPNPPGVWGRTSPKRANSVGGGGALLMSRPFPAHKGIFARPLEARRVRIRALMRTPCHDRVARP